MPKYLKTKDITYLLGISRTTLDDWIKKGKFPQPIKIDHILLWKEDDIDAWMESKRKPAVA